jgi:hypothetical protein
VEKAVNSLLKKFLECNRTQIKNKDDIYLMLDAGWSHFGWWARKCTIITLMETQDFLYIYSMLLKKKTILALQEVIVVEF